MMETKAERRGEALTRNQALVLGALEKAEGPLGAYVILDQLREAGLRAPLQVYRALDKLLDAGLIHRLETMNAFVACAHPHCHAASTTAFAICERCGTVEEFADDAVGERLLRWSADRNFRLSKTTIELKGVCGDCAA